MSVVDFKTQEWHILVSPSTEIPENSLVLGDCMDLLQFVPDKSQNMILADLPYGTTNCKWDEVLPMHDHYYFNGAVIGLDNATQKQLNEMGDPSKFIRHGLWTHYKRILKPGGVILLYAQTPFDKVLGASNLKMLKYEWIWEKTQATGHFNAKKMPMKSHENILVFYDKLPTYNPQKTEGHDPVNSYTKRAEVVNKTNIYGKVTKDVSGGGETDRYPRSVLQFPSDKQKNKLNGTLYDTQKPYDLNKYFIETYTNPGDSVFTNVAGSGSEILPCIELGRSFIGIEKYKEPFDIMVKRFKDRMKDECS